MKTLACPWCGQSKFKIVDCSRCLICDNIIHLDKYDYGQSSSKGIVREPCKHRLDGMVHCSTCDELEKNDNLTWDQVSSGNMSYDEFIGISTKKKRWQFWK